MTLTPSTHPSGTRGSRAARWYGDRSLRTKVIAAVGVVGLLTVVLSVVAGLGFRAQQEQTGEVAEDVVLVHDAMQAKFRTADFAGWQTGYAFDVNRGVKDAASDTVGQRAEFVRSTTAFHDDLRRLDVPELTPADRALLQDATTQFARFLAIDDRIVSGYRRGTAADVRASNDLASGASLDVFGKLATDTDRLATSVSTHSSATATQAHDVAGRYAVVIPLVGGLGLLVALGAAAAIAASVTRPVRRVLAVLDRVAEGDLTVSAGVTTRDEVGRMATALDVVTSSLRGTITAAATSAHAVAQASTVLASTSDEIAVALEQTSTQAGLVASAAEQVSSSVQTVAAGSEEMGSSILEIARSASEAAQVAAQAVAAAATTTATVSKLGDSSSEIGAVIKTITAIAEQTNLLALNATIEAARAGDAGKGFSVVAHEVKDLAQETAKATQDISLRVQATQADTRGRSAPSARSPTSSPGSATT
ncbi:methyl-accepting chemotaxis protein [Lapillicoccus jejuensis]|uniref:Methyl-accepting chemotaxis protein n=1 Tax=Lapillicoccus jejuensis TaxID=402171 RepID=A0A542E5V4_9MICO|nr:methyl-accepting chemotaxis protein [Lapillicoccus jejuensis]TQJ10721.1 methyl-accepting chemotaxis protein [Lapillicoccus jejuensis]